MDDDNEKKIVKKDQPLEGDIINQVSSAKFVESFIDKPLDAIKGVAEGIFGAAEVGKTGVAKALARTLLAANSGGMLKQLAGEWKKLREKGRLQTDEEIASNRFAITALIDLVEIIDSNPEKDRVKAVKALFFLIISKDQNDEEELLAYELFKISKELSAAEMIILKEINDLAPILQKEAEESTNPNSIMSPKRWFKRIADTTGYKVPQLVERKMNKLAELGLVSEIVLRSPGIHPKNFKPTELGEELCSILSDYEELFRD